MKPYNIELSTERNQPVETNIKLCQGDNNITFNINISDFDLTGTTVKIVFTQSNGTSVENSAIVNSDKKSCTYNIVGNELQSVGKVVADLKIYDVNNKRLSSACFIFYVELDSLSDGSFPPKNYSASLEKALAECDAATQAALEAVQKVVNIANNLATTEEGFALDARQGKVLNDKITTLNESLSDKILVNEPFNIGDTKYLNIDNKIGFFVISCVSSGVSYHETFLILSENQYSYGFVSLLKAGISKDLFTSLVSVIDGKSSIGITNNQGNTHLTVVFKPFKTPFF